MKRHVTRLFGEGKLITPVFTRYKQAALRVATGRGGARGQIPSLPRSPFPYPRPVPVKFYGAKSFLVLVSHGSLIPNRALQRQKLKKKPFTIIISMQAFII